MVTSAAEAESSMLRTRLLRMRSPTSRRAGVGFDPVTETPVGSGHSGALVLPARSKAVRSASRPAKTINWLVSFPFRFTQSLVSGSSGAGRFGGQLSSGAPRYWTVQSLRAVREPGMLNQFELSEPPRERNVI